LTDFNDDVFFTQNQLRQLPMIFRRRYLCARQTVHTSKRWRRKMTWVASYQVQPCAPNSRSSISLTMQPLTPELVR